jgi:hypothetical protein
VNARLKWPLAGRIAKELVRGGWTGFVERFAGFIDKV